ncbi:MAG: hypothetical protein ACTSUQ_02850 [Candidatus Freyarchaeota archaeon]
MIIKTPKAFGIWTFEEKINVASVSKEEPAEINHKAVYCPFCKERMKMWLEGCTLWHIECKTCDFCFVMKTEDGEIFKKLVGVIYEY